MFLDFCFVESNKIKSILPEIYIYAQACRGCIYICVWTCVHAEWLYGNYFYLSCSRSRVFELRFSILILAGRPEFSRNYTFGHKGCFQHYPRCKFAYNLVSFVSTCCHCFPCCMFSLPSFGGKKRKSMLHMIDWMQWYIYISIILHLHSNNIFWNYSCILAVWAPIICVFEKPVNLFVLLSNHPQAFYFKTSTIIA